MRRNILLAVAVVAVGAALPSAGLAAHARSSRSGLIAQLNALNRRLAGAQKALKHAQGAILGAWGKIGTLQSNDAAGQNGISTLSSRIGTLQSLVTTINSTVQTDVSAINAELLAGASALTTISNALQDPTTGLVGLNNARPLIGFVVSNAAVSGSEFTVTHAGTGEYILSFVNGVGTATDVSKRVVMVQPLPSGGLPIDASSINCSASTMPCGAGDTKGTDELVVTQQPSGALADANFQVSATSG